MQNGINVGNHVTGDQIEAVSSAIAKIFGAARENGMDQKTTQHALDILVDAAVVKDVTIQGATVDARTINIDPV